MAGGSIVAAMGQDVSIEGSMAPAGTLPVSRIVAEAGAGDSGSKPASAPGFLARRPWIGFALRLVFGLVVLSILLSKADLGAVLQAISGVSPVWLAIALLVQLAGKVVWALRWSATLQIFGVHVPLETLVRAIFIGQFFNNFLPSSVGGDFYRGFWILDDPKHYRKSMLLVFMERFLGLIALGFVAFPALVFLVVTGSTVWDLNLLLIFGLLAGLCGTVIVLHPSVAGWVDRRLPSIRARPLADLRRKVLESLRALQAAGWLRSNAFVLSLAVQLVGVAFYYCLGRGLGVPMVGWQYLVVVPLVVLATVLPLTVNGLGIREGALVVLTAALGIDVTANEAIALGLLSSVVLVLVSLIGGGFYIVGKRHGPR